MLALTTEATTAILLGAIAIGACIELYHLFEKKDLDPSILLFASLFVITALACLWALRAEANGLALTVQLVWLIWAFDTFALFGGLGCGIFWTTHKIWPEASPKKSWEGVAFGLASALVILWLSTLVLPVVGIQPVLTLAKSWPAVIVILGFGHLGDFIESYFKRWKVNIKDSGTIFDGHGGVLDRFDAMIFASLAAFVLRVIGII